MRRLRFLLGEGVGLVLFAPWSVGRPACVAPGPCRSSCESAIGLEVPCGAGGWALALVVGTVVAIGWAWGPTFVRGIKQRLAA